MTKYEEYVKRIVDAAEAGDFEEHIKIRSKSQYSVLVESYYKELRGPYFPSLYPELSGESDKQEIPDSLQKYTCNPETNPEFFIQFVPYDNEGVEEITDYYFISLFQVALLIGYRVDNDPRSIINDCPELFTDAIVNRLIDPRNPSTRIPYSKLHKSLRIIGEKIEFVTKVSEFIFTHVATIYH